MTTAKWSAILSALAGISILVAGFGQWWTNTYNGRMLMKRWVKTLFVALIAIQLAALGLALAG